ncbi:hypothetical protein BB560_001450 [Smittium megazygosporum]|uniref:Mechanosensitive ion channel MscS domain-containing protein n=1 Tax=Smittium megazygosporum TaxID=133381 RepID=A0A2T9ZHK6_9FUNG|nr:hypothetical protein BB560_001450 [Smittium megazygosporum]
MVVFCASIAWFAVFYNPNPVINDPANGIQVESWEKYTAETLILMFVASFLFLIEATIMRLIASKFHRESYRRRIEKELDILNVLNRIMDSDKYNQNNNEKEHEVPKISISSLYDKKKLNEVKLQIKRQANLIFDSLLGSKKREYLLPADFVRFFDDQKAIDDFYVFDYTEKGKLSKTEFQDCLIEFYFERTIIDKTLTSMSMVLKDIDKFFMLIVLMIVFVLGLMLTSVDPIKSLGSLATLMVAWSFVFGNSLKTCFDCFIFLITTHPYDIGDHVLIGDKDFTVKRINLLSTTFVRSDGRYTIFPNSFLATSQIINYRRSKNQSELFDADMQLDTPKEKIEELEKQMLEFVKENPEDYKPEIAIRYTGIDGCTVLRAKVLCMYRNNWQNLSNYAQTRSKFIKKLREVLLDLQIVCNSSSLPVIITNK